MLQKGIKFADDIKFANEQTEIEKLSLVICMGSMKSLESLKVEKRSRRVGQMREGLDSSLLVLRMEKGDHEPKNVGGLLRQNFVKETDFPETNTPAGTLILAHANCVGLLT